MMKARTMFRSLLLLLVSLGNYRCFGLDLSTCRAPLGIQSGAIPDSSFQASSALDLSLAAHTARIRSAIDGGGWCPKSLIDSQSEEYLQINFVNLTVITLIETQGRHGPFQEDYVDYYRLEYRRDPSHPWIKYRDYRKKEIFSGNSNNNIAEIREIAQPILARELRLFPVQSTDKPAKRMCLRLELYGCLSPDHLISYSIPSGDRRAFDMDFMDKTYDGQINNGLLSNGLGQLMDGDIGSDDIRLDTQSWALRGFEWIGWKKTLKNRTSIPMRFLFDSIRNFTEIRFHTNNMFSKDIEQFRRVNITAFVHEHVHANKYLLIDLSDDRQSEQARWITIPLKDQLAKTIQIDLTFGNANWMLISEIQFISQEISDQHLLQQLNVRPSAHLNSPTTTTITIPLQFIIILAGVLSFLCLIFLLCFTVMLLKHRKKRRLNRYGEKLILQTGHNENQLKLQIPCCNHIEKDTQSSNRSQSSYGAPSSSEPSTFAGTPKLVVRNKCNTFHHPQCVKLLAGQGTTDTDTNFYASTDIITGTNGNQSDVSSTLRGVCGTSLISRAINNTPQMIVPPRKVELIASDTVPPGELFGEGKFGQISVGHVHSHHRVMIRRLTKVSAVSRSMFNQENQLLCSLDHPNLANILFKTLDGLALVSEYTELGDLCLLMRRIAENDLNARLDHSAMLFISCQIAGALSYLESRQLIHRDVSTRNCLVFSDYIIKLTDVAMGSPMYAHCYVTEAHLPVRWMSPEILMTGTNGYSSKSDVYSFGITLYEMMTTCRLLPFAHLSDQAMLMSTPLATDLDLASIDTVQLKELLDLMFACLRLTPHERPAFQDIHRFLYQQQKQQQPAAPL